MNQDPLKKLREIVSSENSQKERESAYEEWYKKHVHIVLKSANKAKIPIDDNFDIDFYTNQVLTNLAKTLGYLLKEENLIELNLIDHGPKDSNIEYRAKTIIIK